MQRTQNGSVSKIAYPSLPIRLTIRDIPRDVGKD
jgi:hypothetical protein